MKFTLDPKVTLLIFIGAVLGAILALISGCAAPPRHRTAPQQPVVQPTPSPVSLQWQPVIEQFPSQPIARPRVVEIKKRITKTAAEFPFDTEHEYQLACPFGELLTVEFAPGERYVGHEIANSEEWITAVGESSTNGEPVVVLIVKATPAGKPATLVFITDRSRYRIKLAREGRGENRSVRLVRFRNQADEQRKEDDRFARAERRKQRAAEPRTPQLNPGTARPYLVSGGPVAWQPVSVTGDHAHTFIQLPPNIPTVPTLSVIENGIETRVNGRTVPGNGQQGPQIIVDGTITEAVLSGPGGQISIREGE